MKKNKQTPAPPTLLVITLEADGNGSLLARRGDLAHLSQFIYDGLSDIVAAIQQGATALIALEQDPPSINAPQPAPVEPVAPVAQPAHEDSLPQADAAPIVVEPPLPSVSQTKLM